MEIIIEQQYLAELFYTGKTSDKKHRFQPQIIRKYIRTIDILESVNGIEELFKFNSLNYEVLQGDKKGVESVRVNDQYRIEFKTQKVSSDVIFTICNIVELSNHYKR